MKTTTKTTVTLPYQDLVAMVKGRLPYPLRDYEIEVIVLPPPPEPAQPPLDLDPS